MKSPPRKIVAAIVLSLSAVSGGNAEFQSALAEFSRLEQTARGAVARVPFSDPDDPRAMPRRTAQRPNIAPSSAVCGSANLSSLTESIHVSPEGQDSPGCGDTAATACKTIRQGIANCAGDGCGVLVRWGLYGTDTTIELHDGVSLYGGCRFDDSTSQPYRTILKAPPGGKPAISARDVNTATILYGFVLLGSDATSAGQASIAMTVGASTGLTIQNSVLVAGKGADGEEGKQPAQALSGGDGDDATDSTPGQGGPACPSQTPATTAGEGGTGGEKQTFSTSGCFLACNCTPSNSGKGLNGADSGTTKGGVGGAAGGKGCGCTALPGNNNVPDGDSGHMGAEGQCASGGGSADANIWGTFTASNWSPGSGGSGLDGAVGSGGGGGGAGGIAALANLSNSPDTFPGLPGGGGGGGGCGAHGGPGGQQGGASLPLVLLSSNVDLVQNSLVPGPAGKGGMGGQGGSGGAGGEGGSGATGHATNIEQFGFCSAKVPGSGNSGGSGGRGGAGAGGAGGNGGPSIGIALVGGSPAPANDDGIYEGQEGAPGLKGPGGKNPSGSCTGAAGVDGKNGGKASWHAF